MLENREQPDRIQALTTEEVLRIETEQLWGREEAAAIWDGGDPGTTPIERYGRAMHRNGQAALCLSGGGIRSAAFALGVVQALARKGLLAEFQYLSTVSGGGYLGGFLSRWIEERNGRVSEVEDALAGRGKPIAVEPSPVRWLRENSNFITPRIGIASADTWTAIAVSVRNVLINWLVFAPALLLAAMVPNLAAALLVVSDGFFADICLVGGTVLVGFATFHAARDLPSHHRREHRRHHDGGYVLKRIVLPATLGPAALAAGVAHDLIGVGPGAIDHPLLGVWHFDWLTFLNGDQRIVQALTTAFSCLLAALIGGYAAAGIAASRVPDEELRRSNAKGFRQNAPVWVIGSAIASLFYVSGLALVPWVPCPLDVAACGRKVDALATLAVIFGILAQLALTILFVAFRWVARDQKLSPDLDREWLARLSAQKIRLGLAWTLFAAACLLSWHIVARLMGDPQDFGGT
jgi:hypothetical protein